MMKGRKLFIMLLCLLLLSNIATYYFTRSLASRTALGVAAEETGNRLFWEVRDILEKKYFQPVDGEKLMEGAIKGMLQSLEDPHTLYLTPEAMEDMLIHTTGSLSGIGVEIVEEEGEIFILRVFDNSPAWEAGLRRGDCIIAVDGQSLKGIKLDEAARLIRGPRGTAVELVIRREGEKVPLELTITRDTIEIKTVFARFLENGIGYIKITGFDQGTGKDFEEALAGLEKQALRGLILDLRDNSGGLLDEAVAIGKNIVPAGEITRVVDRQGQVKERYLSRARPKEYNIIVLVNEYTASAAEIIAGALRDSGKARLVGMPTFGKATVQQLHYLSNGGGLRYTMARYLTPAGHDLHQQGLQPDFEVDLPPEYYLQYYTLPQKLKQGDTGEKVLLLQKMLSFLGYPLQATGIFDAATVEILKEFQREHQLPPTGQLDILTREHFHSALAEKASDVDRQLQFAVNLLAPATTPGNGSDRAVN